MFLKESKKHEYNNLEDESKKLATKDWDAFAWVKTVVSGEGVVEFDSERGRVIRSKTVADATSTAVEIKSGTTSKRELKTTVTVEAKK